MLDTRGMRYEEKLSEWIGVISECIQSGKSTARWCEENGVAHSSYRRWEGRIQMTIASLKGAGMAIESPDIVLLGDSVQPIPACSGSASGLVRVGLRSPVSVPLSCDTEAMAEAAEHGHVFPQASPAGPSTSPAMSIHIGTVHCEVYNGADTGTIERTLLALKKIC